MLRPPNRIIRFVLPWHVQPSHGGAEALAFATASRLADAGARAEIWTTTAHPGQEGREPEPRHFRPGKARDGAITVNRFETVPRDTRLFHQLNARVDRGERLSEDEEDAFFRNWIWSEELRKAIHQNRDDSLFIFAPYFAATTVLGIQAAPQESILLPCLHNEPHAKFGLVRRAFAVCHHFFFNSAPEQDLAERMFDLSAKRCLIAAGIDYAENGDPPAETPPPLEARKPYVLALGRQSAAKGVPEMVEFFRRLLSETPLPLKLALAGAGSISIPKTCADSIVNLGYVEEPVKWSLLANAACYVLPSANESLSLSLLESWLCGRPAVVNGAGEVASKHIRLSRGGLAYHSYAEFRHCLETLVREPETAAILGASGKEYVMKNFSWSAALEKQIRFMRDIEQWLAEASLV
jgi:glycosyltransferase involved in cell wall biosynthesis